MSKTFNTEHPNLIEEHEKQIEEFCKQRFFLLNKIPPDDLLLPDREFVQKFSQQFNKEITPQHKIVLYNLYISSKEDAIATFRKSPYYTELQGKQLKLSHITSAIDKSGSINENKKEEVKPWEANTGDEPTLGSSNEHENIQLSGEEATLQVEELD